MIGLDGRMNEDAGEFAGLTQKEANERIVARLARAGPAREAGAVPALGRSLRPLRHADRAADHAPVVGEDEAAGRAGRRRRSATAGCASLPSSRTTSRSTGSTTSATGASRARSGGGTGSRSWYCPDGHMTVAESTPDACAECGSTEIRQDEDVLDTWFSSALWPFATLGWPDDDARPRLLLSERRERDRPRDHLPLGGADDHVGARADGRGARSTT